MADIKTGKKTLIVAKNQMKSSPGGKNLAISSLFRLKDKMQKFSEEKHHKPQIVFECIVSGKCVCFKKYR